MNSSDIINSLGLCIDIAGAALVFFNSPEKKYTTFLYTAAEQKELNQKAKKTRFFARAGFALLAIGFIVQFISNYL